MKLGCTSFSFNKEFMKGKMDINSFIKICKELDINSVELWDEHFEMFLNQGGSISILENMILTPL